MLKIGAIYRFDYPKSMPFLKVNLIPFTLNHWCILSKNKIFLLLDYKPGVLMSGSSDFYKEKPEIKILIDGQICEFYIGDHWLDNFVEIEC